MILPYLREAVANLFSKPADIPFPQADKGGFPDYRGRIAYDAEKCVNCGMCVRVCSPGAITRTYKNVEGGKRVTYEFDLTSCTFCGMCQDFCDDGAISLTTDYHMVARDASELCTRGTRFAPALDDLYCSDKCIFCSLCQKGCPQDAITVDRKAKSWTVDYEKCVQCGKCIKKCPKKALSFGKPAEAEAEPEAEKETEVKAAAKPEKEAGPKPEEKPAETAEAKAEEKPAETAEAKAEEKPAETAEAKAEEKPAETVEAKAEEKPAEAAEEKPVPESQTE